MTGFDLGSVQGFDLARFQREMLQAMGQQSPAVQDPTRVAGEGAAPTVAPASQSFESALGDSLASIRSLQEDVQQKTRGLVLGEDVELHEVMLAANKSEVAMNLLLEVRNKLVDAWEILSRSAV
jgi:flagellar hook-basal body complex protein FliE